MLNDEMVDRVTRQVVKRSIDDVILDEDYIAILLGEILPREYTNGIVIAPPKTVMREYAEIIAARLKDATVSVKFGR